MRLENDDYLAALLFSAVSADEASTLQALLERLGAAEVVDLQQDGITALYAAAALGHLASARVLVGAGASLDSTAVDGTTPLMVAASAGHAPMVAELLALGASPRTVDRAGHDALSLAMAHGQAAAVAELLDRGVPLPSAAQQWPSLANLAYAGHDDVLALLQQRGVDLAPLLDADDLLLAVAQRGQAAVTARLLTLGMPAAGAPGRDCPPLCAAAGSGNVETVVCLLAAGADLEARTALGATPLFSAAVTAQLDALQCLLSHGPDLEAQDQAGATALAAASRHGYLDVVAALLDAGADPRPGIDAAEKASHLEVTEALECVLAGRKRPPQAILSVHEPARENVRVAVHAAADPSNADWMRFACEGMPEFREEMRHLPIKPHVAGSAGCSGVTMMPALRLFLEVQSQPSEDLPLYINQLIRELFIGIFVFEQPPFAHLDPSPDEGAEEDGRAMVVVPPCYANTFVSRVLIDLAVLQRSCMTGLWLPRSRRVQLPPQVPLQPAAQRRLFTRLGALDLWDAAPGGAELKSAVQAWEAQVAALWVDQVLVQFSGLAGTVAQHEHNVLVMGAQGVDTLASGPNGLKPAPLEPAAMALAKAAAHTMVQMGAARHLRYGLQAIAFFVPLFEDMRAQGLMPDLTPLDAVPMVFPHDRRTPFCLAPADTPSATRLARGWVQALAYAEPPTQRAWLPQELADLPGASELSADLGGRCFHRVDLPVLAFPGPDRRPSWLSDMRRQAGHPDP